MREISKFCDNKAVITGKLMECTVDERTSKTSGAPYASAIFKVRVAQEYDGNDVEVSEITLRDMSSKFSKKDNTILQHFTSIENMRALKTTQLRGYDNADMVYVGRGSLRENYYTNNSGVQVDGFDVSAGFGARAVSASSKQQAVFNTEIFILNIREEISKDEQLTGRVIVRGAVVQYGSKVDVLDFIIENPQNAQAFMSRFQEGETTRIWGYIRCATREVEKTIENTDSWGSANTVKPSTEYVRELIVSGGNPMPNDEDNSYDPADIRKALAERDVRMKEEKENKLNAPRATSKAPVAEKPAASAATWGDDSEEFSL